MTRSQRLHNVGRVILFAAGIWSLGVLVFGVIAPPEPQEAEKTYFIYWPIASLVLGLYLHLVEFPVKKVCSKD